MFITSFEEQNITYKCCSNFLIHLYNKYKGMGLDYAKALLIHDESYVSEEIFLLKSKAAGRKLIGKEKHITEQFEQYVEKYIKALKNKDKNILNSKEYRHTTLVNYHSELSIE